MSNNNDQQSKQEFLILIIPIDKHFDCELGDHNIMENSLREGRDALFIAPWPNI
jgi:hypothetical protein